MSSSSVKSVIYNVYCCVIWLRSILISTYDVSSSSSHLHTIRLNLSIVITVAHLISWWRQSSPYPNLALSPSISTESASHFSNPAAVPMSCQMIFRDVELRVCSISILDFYIMIDRFFCCLRSVFRGAESLFSAKIHFFIRNMNFFCQKFWRLTKMYYLCTRNQTMAG